MNARLPWRNRLWPTTVPPGPDKTTYSPPPGATTSAAGLVNLAAELGVVHTPLLDYQEAPLLRHQRARDNHRDRQLAATTIATHPSHRDLPSRNRRNAVDRAVQSQVQAWTRLMTQPAETEAAWCRLAGLAEVYIDLAMGLDRRSIYLTDPQP